MIVQISIIAQISIIVQTSIIVLWYTFGFLVECDVGRLETFNASSSDDTYTVHVTDEYGLSLTAVNMLAGSGTLKLY